MNRSNKAVYVIIAQIMVMILNSLLYDWKGSPQIAAWTLDTSAKLCKYFLVIDGVWNLTQSLRNGAIREHAFRRCNDELTAGALACRIGKAAANGRDGFG